MGRPWKVIGVLGRRQRQPWSLPRSKGGLSGDASATLPAIAPSQQIGVATWMWRRGMTWAPCHSGRSAATLRGADMAISRAAWHSSFPQSSPSPREPLPGVGSTLGQAQPVADTTTSSRRRLPALQLGVPRALRRRVRPTIPTSVGVRATFTTLLQASCRLVSRARPSGHAGAGRPSVHQSEKGI